MSHNNFKQSSYKIDKEDNNENANDISSFDLFDAEKYWNFKSSIKDDVIFHEFADPLIKRIILSTATDSNTFKDCDLQLITMDFLFCNFNHTSNCAHDHFNNYEHHSSTDINNHDALKKLSLSINANIISSFNNKNELKLQINY
ncbi:uncharacterized protein ASCRUDRAFT_14298 [Ascoidea rubescens DSM 1968]|uniref:Uncharacterized protein n=1 Tax=Ascoidea rubescens DSM 1968 TaxID=1344418 RepID=A0A1D2VF07_9ASCO|nr:hypothetical protein ASCRUDRAFT_14298 [Ascoidea rubescens DSM 1968]ODV60162.1 hypothetical protein ASCRUDRAFT_14298 [Ascoidea rubescens DSM 1968]